MELTMLDAVLLGLVLEGILPGQKENVRFRQVQASL